MFSTKLIDVILAGESIDSAQGIFLVTEYVRHDMSKLIYFNKSVDFSEDHVVIIMYNLLCAFNFLHKANIMHRDIKPANILINDQCHVKICDFGMARTIDEEHNLSDDTNDCDKSESSTQI
jgi:mitogen-activated protein kinase 1/3